MDNIFSFFHLELHVSRLEVARFDTLMKAIEERSWCISECEKYFFENNRTFIIRFDAIKKTITLASPTIEDIHIIGPAGTGLDTYLIGSCIAALKNIFEHMSNVNVECYTKDELYTEIIRVNDMYFNEIEVKGLQPYTALMVKTDRGMDSVEKSIYKEFNEWDSLDFDEL